MSGYSVVSLSYPVGQSVSVGVEHVELSGESEEFEDSVRVSVSSSQLSDESLIVIRGDLRRRVSI